MPSSPHSLSLSLMGHDLPFFSLSHTSCFDLALGLSPLPFAVLHNTQLRARFKLAIKGKKISTRLLGGELCLRPIIQLIVVQTRPFHGGR